jgi:26S proteasome regulatory complex component, contains PCI domain
LWRAHAGAQKKIPEADAALAQLTKDFAETAAYQIAEVYAYRGDKDKAFEWLERARRQRDPGLASLRKDPLLTNIQDDRGGTHSCGRWDSPTIN